MSAAQILRIGLVSISDRASAGVYSDAGLPALKNWLDTALATPFTSIAHLIADQQEQIEQTLIHLCDSERCDLILTTGGTGPARRDVTPEATLAVASRQLPGFGEQMRQVSLQFVPTAILSRQVAVIRQTNDHACLIINLPGQPKAIAQTLEGLKDAAGKIVMPGIFAAVPYCLELIGGPLVQTHASVVASFRPKTAATPES